jgi:hypothetical protein
MTDFDLDAARASRAEVEQEPFHFTTDGHRYTIPAQNDWPLEVAGAIAENNLPEVMKLLLGREDYKRFAVPGRKMGDLDLIMSALAGHMGIDLPNSVAPPQPASIQT